MGLVSSQTTAHRRSLADLACDNELKRSSAKPINALPVERLIIPGRKGPPMKTGRRSFVKAVGATMMLQGVSHGAAPVPSPPRAESYLGSLAPVIRAIQQEIGFPLDYEHRGKRPLKEWRARGRAEVER